MVALNSVHVLDTPRIVRSPIVRSGKALPPSSVTARGTARKGTQNCVPQGRKNSININFSVRISRGHSRPLRPDEPGPKGCSPSPGLQKNTLFGADIHDFRRGRPRPKGFSKNFVQKKFALIFWPLVPLLPRAHRKNCARKRSQPLGRISSSQPPLSANPFFETSDESRNPGVSRTPHFLPRTLESGLPRQVLCVAASGPLFTHRSLPGCPKTP